MYSYLCVFVLYSTQLDSTQLDWHMKVQPFRFRMRGIRYSNSERIMGQRGEVCVDGRWATSTRSPFPRGLKLIITFFTHNFTLH